jgi:hypothetical protein
MLALVALAALRLADAARSGHISITDSLLVLQDGPFIVGFLALYLLLSRGAPELPARLTDWLQRSSDRAGPPFIIGLAVAAAAAVLIGWTWLYQAFPMSMDEFWPTFDARVFASGRLMAPIPPEWRAYAHAMQPIYQLETPDHAFWISSYLPLNAAARALASWLGGQALAGAAWAAAAILCLWDIARQLWPARRDAAVVAVGLLALSPQFLAAAMTPFAWPAHLALNLAWLALFLRRSPGAQAGAAVVAFAACGLHEWVFAPLFAGPFLIEAWFAGRRREAILQGAAFGLSCGFWFAWPGLVFMAHGYPFGAARMSAADNALTTLLRPEAPLVMAENLLRLTTWQSPLAALLAVAGITEAVRRRSPPLLAMAGGLVLAIAFFTLVTPYQAQGWGYRYLHGYLGSISLLAAAGWVRLSDVAPRRGWSVLTLGGALAVMLVGCRAGQIADYVAPSVRLEGMIQRSPADVVIVDPGGPNLFRLDLARNDPFLANRPKVMLLPYLTWDEIRALGERKSLELFIARRGEACLVPVGVMASPGLRPLGPEHCVPEGRRY